MGVSRRDIITKVVNRNKVEGGFTRCDRKKLRWFGNIMKEVILPRKYHKSPMDVKRPREILRCR